VPAPQLVHHVHGGSERFGYIAGYVQSDKDGGGAQRQHYSDHEYDRVQHPPFFLRYVRPHERHSEDAVGGVADGRVVGIESSAEHVRFAYEFLSGEDLLIDMFVDLGAGVAFAFGVEEGGRRARVS